MSTDLARELVNAVLAAVEHADDGNAPNRVAEAALAAAEERGRRAGIEERDRLLRILAQLVPAMHRASRSIFISDAEMDALVKAQVTIEHPNLAPRDSAPRPGISDEQIRDALQRGERDRRMAESNNPAPRDSGKEDQR